MRHDGERVRYVSPASVTGFVAIALAFILVLFDVPFAVIPLYIFLFLCLVAPFFVSRGFFLPVLSRGHTGRSVVSLTFDDGPDTMTTRPLLQLLDRHAAKAAFFVIGEKAAKYGDLISEILAHGHDIGNHSYSHDPLLMLRCSEKLYREIESTQVLLRRFGISPAAFRPPVGITNPGLAHVLSQQNLYCVTFNCRAFDGGNRYLQGLSDKILRKVQPDDIILLHDVRPKSIKDAGYFLHEVDLILSGLEKRALRVIPLAELLGRPVMVRIKNIFDTQIDQ
ncbi:MAG: polysaccharide deacetylase family protein [Syntrophales bacterium]